MKALAVATPDAASLPAMVDRAVAALTNARTCAEVLEARDLAGVVYDLAKKTARLGKAKQAHDSLIAQAHRTQADAVEIEARAKHRLADEYDAAQDRDEVATVGRPKIVPDGNDKSIAADLGITRKEIHEARQIRDAEQADPGVVRRTLDEALDAGDEPTRAKVKRAVNGTYRTKHHDTTAQMDTTNIGGTVDNRARISVPDGLTASDLCRQGMELEASGEKTGLVAKKIGVGRKSYREMRSIILLSDRDDLDERDAELVRQAVSILNHQKRSSEAHELVLPLVTKVWGSSKRGRPQNSKVVEIRIENFERAISVIVQACSTGRDLDVPHLAKPVADRLIKQLVIAVKNISQIKSNIKGSDK